MNKKQLYTVRCSNCPNCATFGKGEEREMYCSRHLCSCMLVEDCDIFSDEFVERIKDVALCVYEKLDTIVKDERVKRIKYTEGIDRKESLEDKSSDHWDYSEEAIKMLDEYEAKHHRKYVDYVIEVWCKHKDDKDYYKSYQLCTYDCSNNFEWDQDWFEGEECVIYKRVVPLMDILDYYFEHNKLEEI